MCVGGRDPTRVSLLRCLTYSCVTFQRHSKGIFLWESVSSLRPHADNRPLCVHALRRGSPGWNTWAFLGQPGQRNSLRADPGVRGVRAGLWDGKSGHFGAAGGSVVCLAWERGTCAHKGLRRQELIVEMGTKLRLLDFFAFCGFCCLSSKKSLHLGSDSQRPLAGRFLAVPGSSQSFRRCFSIIYIPVLVLQVSL